MYNVILSLYIKKKRIYDQNEITLYSKCNHCLIMKFTLFGHKMKMTHFCLKIMATCC